MQQIAPETSPVQLAAQHPVLILQFGSQSCAPCKAIHARLDRWLDLHPAVCGVYVPIEDFPQLAAQNQVFTVPTVLVYVDGRCTLRESGYFSLDELLAQAERYLDLLGLD